MRHPARQRAGSRRRWSPCCRGWSRSAGRGWPGGGLGGLGHDLSNSTTTGTIASGSGRWPCPGRVRRLALGRAAATASAASGKSGEVWSPEHTIAGTVS